jgi:hypothetical protein
MVISPAPSPREGQSPSPDILPAKFAALKDELRAKGPLIGDGETVEYLWHVINYIKGSDLSPVGNAAWDPSVDTSPTSATDERLCVLKIYIIREEQNEGRLRLAKSLARLRKRLYLVELVGNYMDEHEAWEVWKAQPRSKRRKTKGRLPPPEQVYRPPLPGHNRVEGHATGRNRSV